MEMFRYMQALTYWDWIGFGVLLLILELLMASGGFLLWLAAAAVIIAGLIWVFPTMLWPYQLLIFSVLGMVCSVVWWSYLLSHAHYTDNARGAEHYKGQVFVLETPIVNGKGMLHVEKNAWHISGPDLPAGTHIRILDVQHAILQVEKA